MNWYPFYGAFIDAPNPSIATWITSDHKLLVAKDGAMRLFGRPLNLTRRAKADTGNLVRWNSRCTIRRCATAQFNDIDGVIAASNASALIIARAPYEYAPCLYDRRSPGALSNYYYHHEHLVLIDAADGSLWLDGYGDKDDDTETEIATALSRNVRDALARADYKAFRFLETERAVYARERAKARINGYYAHQRAIVATCEARNFEKRA